MNKKEFQVNNIKPMNAYLIITDGDNDNKKFELSLTPVENSSKITILPNHLEQCRY